MEIQNEIRVNLINESRWHHLSSFCSGAAELDATAPLPPSNKYMDNCWPPLLDTLTSCLNNCGGTQLGQLLLLLLASAGRLPEVAQPLSEGGLKTGGQVVRAGNPSVY